MGVFGFIENFFFISLGIAFALVLLLVYHFKNRMSVAEKKSETMYGLLSSVVKEIKSLRSMFGIKLTPSTDVPLNQPSIPDDSIVAKKSEPEIHVNVGSEQEVITVNLANSPTNLKIVVSDEEDSDEEDSEEDDSESEEESDSESESDDDLSVEDLDSLLIDNSSESNIVYQILPETLGDATFNQPVSDDGIPISGNGSITFECPVIHQMTPEESSVEIESVSNLDFDKIPEVVDIRGFAELKTFEDLSSNENGVASLNEVATLTTVEDEPSEVDNVNEPELGPKHKIDQLKKMNINQLKTIAIQTGITVDTSKLKKHDLISLIMDA